MPQNQHQQSGASAAPPARSGAKSARFKMVACPTCNKQGNWLAAPSGPFCSWRCRLLDLGKWLNGEYRVGEPLPPEHLEKRGNPPHGGHLGRPRPD